MTEQQDTAGSGKLSSTAQPPPHMLPTLAMAGAAAARSPAGLGLRCLLGGSAAGVAACGCCAGAAVPGEAADAPLAAAGLLLAAGA